MTILLNAFAVIILIFVFILLLLAVIAGCVTALNSIIENCTKYDNLKDWIKHKKRKVKEN